MSHFFVLHDQSFTLNPDDVEEIVKLMNEEGEVIGTAEYSDEYFAENFKRFAGLSLQVDGFFVDGQEIFISKKHVEFLRKIAPYVEEGSWLEFRDTEEHFRLVFDGVSMKEAYPVISWEVSLERSARTYGCELGSDPIGRPIMITDAIE